MEACKECQSLDWTGLDLCQAFHPKCTQNHGVTVGADLAKEGRDRTVKQYRTVSGIESGKLYTIPPLPEPLADALANAPRAKTWWAAPGGELTEIDPNATYEIAGNQICKLSDTGARIFYRSAPMTEEEFEAPDEALPVQWENLTVPPIDCDSLVSLLGVLVNTGDDGNSSTAVTGEPFITFSLGGRVAEGESAKAFATSESAAVEGLYFDLIRYAQSVMRDRPRGEFALYWRERPNLIRQRMTCDTAECGLVFNRNECTGHDYVAIWCRLLISDKPPLAKEA